MTANKLLNEFYDNLGKEMLADGSIDEYRDDLRTLMIQFAKLHVLEALKSANESVTYTTEIDDRSNSCLVIIDEESILNSYPLTNVI